MPRGRLRVCLGAAPGVGKTGELVHLTKTEWDLLAILVRNPGKLVSQRQPPARRVGIDLPQGDPLPAPVHGTTPQEARTRPHPSPAPPDRTRHGPPLHALTDES
jgi:hypothetical protein